MKNLLLILTSITLLSCGSTHIKSQTTNAVIVTDDIATTFANTITTKDLKEYLYAFASKEFEGRETGELGQKKAAEYLKTFYTEHQIASPYGGTDYFQSIPTEYLRPELNPSENVVAFIKGSEKPDEILVISAHYDHLGMNHNKIYRGQYLNSYL